jgi:hypothetical protein
MPAYGHSDPAGQASHDVEPEYWANRPAEHAVQTVAPAMDVNDPDSQGTSTLEEDWFVKRA